MEIFTVARTAGDIYFTLSQEFPEYDDSSQRTILLVVFSEAMGKEEVF